MWCSIIFYSQRKGEKQKQNKRKKISKVIPRKYPSRC